MRMKLYQAAIRRQAQAITGFVVAPDEQRATEIVTDHAEWLGRKRERFALERVDETLPDDQRHGLAALLEHAPVGFASYCDGVGWIAHAATVARLHLFKVEEASGKICYIVGPSPDFARMVYSGTRLAGLPPIDIFVRRI